METIRQISANEIIELARLNSKVGYDKCKKEVIKLINDKFLDKGCNCVRCRGFKRVKERIEG